MNLIKNIIIFFFRINYKSPKTSNVFLTVAQTSFSGNAFNSFSRLFAILNTGNPSASGWLKLKLSLTHLPFRR